MSLKPLWGKEEGAMWVKNATKRLFMRAEVKDNIGKGDMIGVVLILFAIAKPIVDGTIGDAVAIGEPLARTE